VADTKRCGCQSRIARTIGCTRGEYARVIRNVTPKNRRLHQEVAGEA